MTTPSIEQLKRALEIAEQIQRLESEIATIIGSQPAAAPVDANTGANPKARKGMSAAGRARVAAAQRARWAKLKGKKASKKAAPNAKRAKRKGGITPAGRARIAAAMKSRWAATRAAEAVAVTAG